MPQPHPDESIDEDKQICPYCDGNLDESEFVEELGQTYTCDCEENGDQKLYPIWADDLGPETLHWRSRSWASDESNSKTTNWEIDKEIVQCLVDYSAFSKPGVEVHHGHVSGYIGHGQGFSFKAIPSAKYRKLASQVVERRPSMATDGSVTKKERLYQVAGSFHLVERKIEHTADDADVSYLRWGKGKSKFQEITGTPYNEFIAEEVEENGRQPWMSSTPGWSVDGE